MSAYEDLCSALAIALTARVPVVLWGGPGVGKTSVVGQIAETRGWHLETVIASICDPTDFKGMPRDAGDRTTFLPPEWAVRVAEAGGGLVFLDEISTAPPSVQAALLRPVLTGIVGDLVLPLSTRFVAAANPPDTAADGWELSAPLANRFVHLDWDVPASVIAEGFTYGFAPIAIPSIDPLVAQTRTDEVRRMIGAFAGARPELMHRMPDAATERGRAWPSPRSWEFASLLVGHARAAGASKGVARLLLSGCVGKSAASEFLAWERALDLPNVETALRNNGVIEVPATPDRVVAMCGGLVAAVKQDPTKQRCAAAVNGILVAVAVAGHVDLATVALRRIASEVKAAGAALSPEAVAHFGGILSRMGTLKASA